MIGQILHELVPMLGGDDISCNVDRRVPLGVKKNPFNCTRCQTKGLSI